ncbi:uncharacterized protein Z518_00793 [Rhinocladiella mackenziei CBS 650.93]|uniref:NADH-ubiquinone oxidoreductase n=1 Tax=Rhinocladiella mackenziei CBS 650.93 TaxID=1442369 RepID=A0A0D2G4R2_9EURO|nr:uncharacterized protein Z518_00793 [Rhinocladiella mackenziei CBS 650.93]KIX09712.1 hypothetical protein Z518_00793 [Rhinocladiella mackenziei CBS 650.93]
MANREARFNTDVFVDTTPMPDHIPKVKEIGASSAPLLSASFFIGARCRPYNDDYMQCKTEALEDINKNCLEEFRAHWMCLENNNHQLWQCRRPERALNRCVFQKIGLEKTIPDTPKGQTPIHLRDKQLFADTTQVVMPWEKDVGIRKDEANKLA